MAIEDLPSRTFGPGDVIFRQGDNSHGEAYLVHEGSVEVRRLVDGEDRVLRTLAKGNLLGEVALFRDAPHSATAVALEETPRGTRAADAAWAPVETISLSEAGFERIYQGTALLVTWPLQLSPGAAWETRITLTFADLGGAPR